ncbi:hypothetical protein KC347_g97 [Hortaea werneckii]|nr:hypothetical protein KC347_g97 [Hortaea werneckii]
MTSPTLLDLTGSSELPSSFPVVLACCLAAALGVPEENSASDGGPTSDLERGVSSDIDLLRPLRSWCTLSFDLPKDLRRLKNPGRFCLPGATSPLALGFPFSLPVFPFCLAGLGTGGDPRACVGDLPARVRDGVIASGVKVGVVFCYLAQQFIPLTKVLEAIGVQGCLIVGRKALRWLQPILLHHLFTRKAGASINDGGEGLLNLSPDRRLVQAAVTWTEEGGLFQIRVCGAGMLGDCAVGDRLGRGVDAHNIAPYQQPGLLDAEPGKEELLRSIPPLRRMDEAEGFDAIAEEPSPLCRVPCCCRNAAGHVDLRVEAVMGQRAKVQRSVRMEMHGGGGENNKIERGLELQTTVW